MWKYIYSLRRLWETYQWYTHNQIISFANNVTRLSLHAGTVRHILLRFTMSFTQEMMSRSRIHKERKPSPCSKCGIIFTLRVDFGRCIKGTHTQAKQIITSATNVTGLSLHVGTLRHILLRFTRRFTHEISLLTVPLKLLLFLVWFP